MLSVQNIHGSGGGNTSQQLRMTGCCHNARRGAARFGLILVLTFAQRVPTAVVHIRYWVDVRAVCEG
jgi:hypothetical protein